MPQTNALTQVVLLIVSNSALIPAELLVRAHRRGLRITEVDVEHSPRRRRQTGAKFSEILRVHALDLLRLRRLLSRSWRCATLSPGGAVAARSQVTLRTGSSIAPIRGGPIQPHGPTTS